jgi:hypothetical protein
MWRSAPTLIAPPAPFPKSIFGEVYLKVGSTAFNEHTIFKVPSFRGLGPAIYLLNQQSIVHVGSYSFRNAPHFMPFWVPICAQNEPCGLLDLHLPSLRLCSQRPVDEPAFQHAAEYETEADHILHCSSSNSDPTRRPSWTTSSTTPTLALSRLTD